MGIFCVLDEFVFIILKKDAVLSSLSYYAEAWVFIFTTISLFYSSNFFLPNINFSFPNLSHLFAHLFVFFLIQCQKHFFCVREENETGRRGGSFAVFLTPPFFLHFFAPSLPSFRLEQNV